MKPYIDMIVKDQELSLYQQLATQASEFSQEN